MYFVASNQLLMKRIFSLALSIASFQFVLAQDRDSTATDYLTATRAVQTDVDLGRMSIRSNFLQGTVIRGRDLEKLPFTRLSDALQPWLHGTYTTDANLVYVIDGHVGADVNSYDIHDIEEVRLVQNAAAMLNGATGQQQLVIVRTRRPSGANSLRFDGRVLAVENPYYNSSVSPKQGSERNLFHQYSLSGNKAFGHFDGGMTLSFLHDVMPMTKDEARSAISPQHIDRYSGRAFMRYLVAARHTLEARIFYLQQPGGEEYAASYPNLTPPFYQHSRLQNRTRYINPEIEWKAVFGSRFRNSLSASGNWQRGLEDGTQDASFGTSSMSSVLRNRGSSHNLLVRERISYETGFGSWTWRPSLNVDYRNLKERIHQVSATTQGGMPAGATGSEYWSEGKKWTSTLLSDLSWGHSFDLIVGAVADLSKQHERRIYPVASMSADLLALAGKNSGVRALIFGSYARSGFFADLAYRVPTLGSREPMFYFPAPVFIGSPVPFPFQSPRFDYDQYQAGSSLRFLNEKLSLDYHYENRGYLAQVYIPSWGGGLFLAFREARSQTHRFALRYHVAKEEKFSWLTALQGTTIRNRISGIEQDPQTPRLVIGDVFQPAHRSWSLGWTNRLNAGPLSFGVDLLYHPHAEIYVDNQYAEKDLFALAYAYAGYGFEWKKHRMEVYLSTRNLYEERYYTMNTDARQYYGLGLQLGL